MGARFLASACLFMLALFASSTAAQSREAELWQRVYSAQDGILGIPFGSTKTETQARLRTLADTEDIGIWPCERDKKRPSLEDCEISDYLWWERLAPDTTANTEHFSLVFLDGLLVGGLHLMIFDGRKQALNDYYVAKEAFAAAYRMPGKNPGFWRRQGAKFGSSLLGTRFVNAATWKGDKAGSGVIFFERGPESILLITHSRKDVE
jgi:hypothetical protein